MKTASERPVLTFFKYTGAGNDFILLDARREPLAGEPEALARNLCRRGHSVGADGLVVLGPADDGSGAAARIRIWNADGSAPSFSGNAARCAARYLVDQGMAEEEIPLNSEAGLVTARATEEAIRIRLPFPGRVHPDRRLRVEGRDLQGALVQVGVPFFVCFHERPEDLPVRFLGRAIRHHPDLAPAGANVDFVRVEDEQRLFFRVYERGVEDETLSSGTGGLAAALAAAAAGRVSSPVDCQARGATLTARFRAPEGEDHQGDTLVFTDLELEGPARRVFRGEAYL